MKSKIILALLGVTIVSLGVYSFTKDSEIKEPITQKPTIYSYGMVEAKVGETIAFKDNSIKVVRVFDESRCPSDVTCIQMGTVKVEIESVSGMGTSTQVLSLNSSFTTEGEEISFIKALPYPNTKTVIEEKDYLLTFEVLKRNTQVTATSSSQNEVGGCYIGGCSGEICSDSKDIVSTCIYKEQFACYKSAKCERQKSGLCGWTESKELQACLQSKEQL